MPPDSPVDVVPADLDVDGAVKFDAGHFGAAEQAMHVDVVDVIAGDGAEGATQAAHNAGLLAMGDFIVADGMAADGFLVPTVPRARG